MAKVMEIKGFQSLVDKLKRVQKSDKYAGGSVSVGFTAKYALYIHENREIWPPGMRLLGKQRPGKTRGMYWDPQPNARPQFLLEAVREGQDRAKDLITDSVHRGLPLVQCLYIAGLYLQRLAQLYVPVDTGNLKASAFTTIDERGQ